MLRSGKQYKTNMESAVGTPVNQLARAKTPESDQARKLREAAERT
jgi:hypothetical protein